MNEIRPDRRTVKQLLAAADKDTDAASVFYFGASQSDFDGAVIVLKGREHTQYVVDVLLRQNLLTRGKSVEGGAA